MVAGPTSKRKYADRVLTQVEPSDLIQFGMIPEFVGRIPIVVAVESLSEDSLIKVLKEPKNSLVKQYQGLFELSGVSLDITDDALRHIATEAIQKKTGARGLRSIMVFFFAFFFACFFFFFFFSPFFFSDSSYLCVCRREPCLAQCTKPQART